MTAGPTYEPLDDVRRLTNFSTGRLGVELAGFLMAAGHRVTLLLGELATFAGPRRADRLERFSSTQDLRARLQALAAQPTDAVLHAAAVSDFGFGTLWRRSPGGQLAEVRAGKVPTDLGPLLAELRPTPKILHELRAWFPRAWLVGWKYELDGDRAAVLARARAQIAASRTDACVANGRAYGTGFGLVTPDGRCEHLEDMGALFAALETLVRPARPV